MSWKTIHINSKQHLKIKNNNLIVKSDEEEISFYMEDLDVLIIDNYQTNITVPTLIELISKNVSVIINNKSHDPAGLLLSFSGHHKPLENFSKQLNLTSREKQRFQQQIIIQKIKNQKNLMEYLKVKKDSLNKMDLYIKQVIQGDKYNREAAAARIFFRSIYGSSFVRFSDDSINKALNYGYKVIASKISSCLVKYGLNPSLGFFHKTKDNYFNLTYDLIEPFRPLVDYFTNKYNEFLITSEGNLNLLLRIKFAEMLDEYIIINNHTTKVRNAIEEMIRSIISYFNKTNDELLMPEIYFDKVDNIIEGEEQF